MGKAEAFACALALFILAFALGWGFGRLEERSIQKHKLEASHVRLMPGACAMVCSEEETSQ